MRIDLGPPALALLVSALALGCDCGGGLPTTRCTTTRDCASGMTCTDGVCRSSDGGSGVDAPFDPDEVVGLRIEPASVMLDIVDGTMPTQRFEAIATTADRTERVLARPIWLFGGDLGDIAADGTFTSDGVSAGEEI